MHYDHDIDQGHRIAIGWKYKTQFTYICSLNSGIYRKSLPIDVDMHANDHDHANFSFFERMGIVIIIFWGLFFVFCFVFWFVVCGLVYAKIYYGGKEVWLFLQSMKEL